MKIGILSDTHNNIEMTSKALSVFKDQGVSMIIHGGDITSPRILDLFKDMQCECKFVLGNSDIDSDVLNERSKKLGLCSIGETCDFTVEGKRFLVFHGDNVAFFRKAVASGEYDYIIKGHTHFFENYVSHRTRIINPGSLFGDEEHTAAILDPGSDRVEKIKIERD
jgi:uncharacterized protein